jgi:hypothetical protein
MSQDQIRSLGMRMIFNRVVKGLWLEPAQLCGHHVLEPREVGPGRGIPKLTEIAIRTPGTVLCA